MKFRLKLYLPILQVGLGFVLGLWGSIQTHQLWAKLGTDHVWDYVAPAEMAMHLMNLPATLICTLLFNRSFQIGVEYSKSVFTVYLVLIAMLWFVVSWCVQDYPRFLHAKPGTARSLRAIGLLIGLVFIALGALLLKGPWPWSVLFPLGMILWGGAIIILFVRKRAPKLEAMTVPGGLSH